MLRTFLTTLVVMAVPSVTLALDEPRAGSQPTIQARCDALFKEFSDASQKWYEGTREAKTDEEAREFTQPNGGEYAARFMAMAGEHPDDPAAVDALVRAILVDPFGPSWAEAIERLKADHSASPKIAQSLYTISFDLTLPTVEPLLRAVRKENPSAQARGEAAYALAHHLRRMGKETQHLREDPEAFRRAASSIGETAASRMRDRDLEAMRREAESLLESVVEPDAQIPEGKQRSLADRATAVLREMRELVVGKPAPEIEGKDVDGEPMKLSDYRGKVVVLVWWATWCGPCMAMVPHERELIRRMEGKPFVLLGINGDEDEGRLKYQMKEEGIHWRSWYDGGPSGAISTRWNVTGWPTVYVLDPDGVIRYKGGRDEGRLDEAVDELLQAGR